jgi:UDP:flavonoid glycosyltransferase YjiC (YdhE family)
MHGQIAPQREIPMSHYLIASVAIHGHVSPLLAVASGLVERGHHVRFLTGARFATVVAQTGSTFVALPKDADYDDRLHGGVSHDRPAGIAGLRYDVAQTFLAPARAQYDALAMLIGPKQPAADAVIVDPTFVGAMLLAAHPVGSRPPVVVGGVLPLPLSSSAVPPFGLGLQPWAGPLNRPRNAVLRTFVEKVVFAPVQRDLDALHRAIHGRNADSFILDWVSRADAIVQFSVPAFEYPRPEAVVPLHFAGPISQSSGTELPDWWSDLDAAQHVVLVTQGTIANTDLAELVGPTLEALADEDVLVVVATGGPQVEELGVLPVNARASQFLRYDLLFPRLAAMVTNGGYGGVHYALAHGVPLVVAGATEDKPEVAARVAWSGTGINLHTGRPKPPAIRRAVRRVLDTPRYQRAAAAMAAQIRTTRGVDALINAIATVKGPALEGDHVNANHSARPTAPRRAVPTPHPGSTRARRPMTADMPDPARS